MPNAYRKQGSTELVDQAGNPVADPNSALASYGYNLEAVPVYGQVSTGNPQIVPTAANGFGTNLPVTEYDSLINERYQESQAPIDREGIRKQKVTQFQAEIDATNQIYNNLIAKAGVEGQDRLGRQRAIASRGGTLNSGRGEAQREQVSEYNRGIVSDVEARKQAALTSIMSEAQNRADEEISKREEAKRLGAEQYLNYLAGTEERKSNNALAVIQGLVAQGLSIEDIPQESWEDLSRMLKIDPYQLSAIYNGELSKVETAAAEAEYERELKDRDFSLEVGKFGLEEEKFLSEQDLKEREFGFEQDKFGVEQDFKERQFGADIGYKYAALNADTEYKNAQLGLEERKLTSDENIALQKLGLDREKLTLEQQKALVSTKSLSAEQKKLNALSLSGMNSLDVIENELKDKGFFSRLVSGAKTNLGLNRDYKAAIDNLSDVIGRLRSGGAITQDEEKRFKNLLPKTGDSMETIKSKLGNIRQQLNDVSPGGDATGFIQDSGSLFDEYEGGSEGTDPKAPISFNSYLKNTGNGRVVTGSKYHRGGEVDIDGKIGDPIPAFEGGKVIAVKDDGSKGYGKHVIVQNNRGERVIYAHLSGFNVKQGQTISGGYQVGKMGNSGNVTAGKGGDGSHLHIERRDKNGRVIALDNHKSHA